MSTTKLYAVFKTGKKIGRLTHLAYVVGLNPHDALEIYLQEQKSQVPTGLVAMPCSGNKFTFYQKAERVSNDLRRRDRLPNLKRLYNQVSWYNTTIPCNQKPYSWQRHEEWCRSRGIVPKDWENKTYKRIQRYS